MSAFRHNPDRYLLCALQRATRSESRGNSGVQPWIILAIDVKKPRRIAIFPSTCQSVELIIRPRGESAGHLLLGEHQIADAFLVIIVHQSRQECGEFGRWSNLWKPDRPSTFPPHVRPDVPSCAVHCEVRVLCAGDVVSVRFSDGYFTRSIPASSNVRSIVIKGNIEPDSFRAYDRVIGSISRTFEVIAETEDRIRAAILPFTDGLVENVTVNSGQYNNPIVNGAL
jgi:hypothetical protein